MKKIALILFIALWLSGCITNPATQFNEELRTHTSVNRPKAMGGTITWSEYYSGALAIAERIPSNVPSRFETISSIREAISMAQEYEAGRISKEDFYKWRESLNAKAESNKIANQKNSAQCEYEAKAGAAAVRDTGRSGLNFDQMYKEKELFELCMRAKQ